MAPSAKDFRIQILYNIGFLRIPQDIPNLFQIFITLIETNYVIIELCDFLNYLNLTLKLLGLGYFLPILRRFQFQAQHQRGEDDCIHLQSIETNG